MDGTLGGGGHAREILRRSEPSGKLLALDADPAAIERARPLLADYGPRVILIHANFCDIKAVAQEASFAPVDGVLLDLGLSSFQLADPTRGFSFQEDGPLDMRFDPEQRITAHDLVNNLDEGELADIFWQYGEERHSRRIAREIVAHRPIESTRHLTDLIKRVSRGHSRIHPATRVFQSLRIAVNAELEALTEALQGSLDILAPKGRMVVISFHSGEDRLVKRFMARESRDCICPPEIPICVCDHQATLAVLTKKPVRPSQAEASRNPRSRSARLRAAAKI